MNHEHLQRAKKLLETERIEGISAEERKWLAAHLDTCAECTNEANALAFAVGSLRSVSVTASPDLVRRTSMVVRLRSAKMRQERDRALPLWIAVGIASVWMIVTAPVTWSIFSWLGRTLEVSDLVWELGFLMWWFLPATVLGAAAAWQHVGDVYGNHR
jgi:anti-sigma factor RsiW